MTPHGVVTPTRGLPKRLLEGVLKGLCKRSIPQIAVSGLSVHGAPIPSITSNKPSSTRRNPRFARNFSLGILPRHDIFNICVARAPRPEAAAFLPIPVSSWWARAAAFAKRPSQNQAFDPPTPSPGPPGAHASRIFSPGISSPSKMLNPHD